ncbi:MULTISPECIES: DUF4188 domain-containing protein [unclassified Pseudonocardia]|uniref:DUF4188 domain-containing protein n=1 Tax=unclassified Pseudonocardia TaxID=2619320 RepID=UPI0001FFE60E|nr:DUF4188 domain-containing protein [Pseudonocardia sp. Ae707_Ps1]OLM18410.1 hypothetical protein Ae707Ps1_2669c [Pseudonocardia sp. Ae707_Ps1]
MAQYTRTTNEATDDEIVVFLIGMRFSKPWRPDAWLPTFTAMPKMLAELSADPGSGLLGYRLTIGAGGPMVVQYWRDHESLYAYANDTSALHRPAWAAFNRRARRVPGAVGIWHETFVVKEFETIYGDMPPTGLAKALGVRTVDARTEGGRRRLAAARRTAA